MTDPTNLFRGRFIFLRIKLLKQGVPQTQNCVLFIYVTNVHGIMLALKGIL